MRNLKFIHCIEDGKTFLGIKNAADYYGVSTAAISKAVVHGCSVRGFHLGKGVSNEFRETTRKQTYNIYDESFRAWYEGKQPIDEKMIHKLIEWGMLKHKYTFEEARSCLSMRFHRECIKRGLPLPKRSRFQYNRKSRIDTKYDLYTWEKAYDLWRDHKWTLQDIAENLGVSISTVHRRLKPFKGD